MLYVINWVGSPFTEVQLNESQLNVVYETTIVVACKMDEVEIRFPFLSSTSASLVSNTVME